MEGEFAVLPSPRHRRASPLPTIGPFLDSPGLFFSLSATCLRASRRRSRLTLDPLGPCFALLSYSPSPHRAALVLFHESGGRHPAAERVPFTCVLPPCLLVCSTLSNSPHNCRGDENGKVCNWPCTWKALPELPTRLPCFLKTLRLLIYHWHAPWY